MREIESTRADVIIEVNARAVPRLQKSRCFAQRAVLMERCGQGLRGRRGWRGGDSYTILYYTILYYTILYYTILYYTILYYTILQQLYYTVLLL